ncbi:MAG: hypothetical protein R6V02_09575 [Candidatus Aminicenantes bacterium]
MEIGEGGKAAWIINGPGLRQWPDCCREAVILLCSEPQKGGCGEITRPKG